MRRDLTTVVRLLGLLFLASAASGCEEWLIGLDGGLDGGSDASLGGDAGGVANGLPCNVSDILKSKCQTCHGNPLMSGPMPLITWEDLQANSTFYPGVKVATRVKERIHNAGSPMPPAARPQLSAQELAVLDAYLESGAPKSNALCGAPVEQGGGFGTYQPPDSECDYMLELRAHGGQYPGDKTPFEPPNGTDHYEMFYFVPTWTAKVHTIRVDPIVDNGAVLHHWLLYMEDGVGDGDGTHNPDLGLQSSSAQLLSGWAPGNKSLPLGREIGLQTIVGPNARFGIEIHYNTTASPRLLADRSGARLCVTKKLRQREASVHWLGTQAILNLGFVSNYETTGVCTVQRESHIIAMSPHMHKRGRYMKTIITRANGTKVAITDKPFAFDDQQIFPIDSPTGEIVVGVGDVIDTTCTYDGLEPFVFGPNTDMEMCYNFVIAWPAGSLSNGVAGIVGGQNTCIDGL